MTLKPKENIDSEISPPAFYLLFFNIELNDEE